MKNESELKEQFAKILLKNPENPFEAALKIFPEDVNTALQIATEWPADPLVINATNDILEDEDELSFLPNKAKLARHIWGKLDGEYICNEDYVKLAKLYAEVLGFIEKPQTNINANISAVSNRVMIVKESGSNDEWEQKLLQQQQKLQSESKH